MNKENRARWIFNLSLALVIALSFLFGFQTAGIVGFLSRQKKLPNWVEKAAAGLSYNAHASISSFADEDLAVFYEVLERISQTYLYRDDINSTNVIRGAAAGAVASLGDHYSRFTPPADQQVLTEEIEGEYAGIGVRILDQIGALPQYAFDCETATGIDPDDFNFLRETRGVIIFQVFENGPAFPVGMEDGDVIVCVDGETLRGGTSQDAADRIKGPEGTMVNVTVYRPSTGEELSFDIERQVVQVHTVSATEMLDDRIGYIKLDEFNQQSTADVARAVNDLLQQGMKGLIFDLRNNTGGVMSAAIQISDLFISDGVMVIYEDNNGQKYSYDSEDKGEAVGIPLVLLVNGGSASSSEIVAGAIRDTHVGLLVGENTFGKGVVQNVYPLQDGSGLVLTTGRYLTPGGNAITQDGITPDVISDLDPERLRAEDAVIDEYLTRIDSLYTELLQIREEMIDYTREHDFQRDTAIEVVKEWLDTGTIPSNYSEKHGLAVAESTSQTETVVDESGPIF